MDQSSRSELLRRNEQIKALSTLGMNFGSALAAAGAARWFFQGLDDPVLLWLMAGTGIIWVGVKVLSLLEAED